MATNEPNITERTEAEFRQYADAWTAKMVEIWQDRLDLMAVHDTGALRRSVQPNNVHIDGLSLEVSFSFLQYGIYVERGTGNGYKRGNDGKLQFLEKKYRKEHGLGKARERRPWFSKSWSISARVLMEHTAKIIGQEYVSAFDNL